MSKLYVLGARQRKLLLKKEEEWNLYEAALILELDTESKAVRTCVEYTSPLAARAHERSSCVFKSGTLFGNTLYACTSTEVMIFRIPSFETINYISLPCFNDLHHITPTSDGALAAAVTGLDMVVKFDLRGRVLAEWSVLKEAAWSRFSKTTDYRKVESTKPHKSHPNFVFELEGDLWVTRFRQRDALCLTDSGRHIEFTTERPHDGLLFGEKIYFTSVDGTLIIVDRHTLEVEKIIDLKQIDGRKSLLGWCRGLLPLDDSKVWVGFTQIRKTQFQENILWVKNVFREGMAEQPSHIALYDIDNRRCLDEFNLEAHGMNILFSIFSVPGPEKPHNSKSVSEFSHV
jgi:hypothetical protein